MECGMKRWIGLLLVAPLALSAADRDAAEWVIRQGGRVMLNANRTPILNLADLPAGEIHVTGLDLDGTLIEPKDLEKIGGLAQLRELYLPGPSFNPASGSRLDA